MMSPNAQAEQEATAGDTAARLTESARYALLRRLAPSMRHHLVVNLQPIGMIYEVMDRRLKAPQPDLADVHESAHKINRFAKAALNSCLDVVTWLAPDDEVRTSPEAGVRECLGLVATSLTFRGYTLRNEVAALPGEVRRSAMRNVLTAALIHATDTTLAPADLVLAAQHSDRALLLALAMNPTAGEPSFTAEPGYRRLEWADVEALAAAEGVEITRDGRLAFRLALPWAPAAQA
jgi:hypothetical protein